MIPFMEQAKHYAVYHQKPLTRYIQFLSIPLFLLSALMLLACVHVTIPGLLTINLAMVATLVLLVHYYRLNWQLALVITPLFILICWLASLFSDPSPTFFTVSSAIIIFILASLVWYAGFYIEGKYPPLPDHRQQLSVAPLLMAADLVFMTKRMRKLEETLYGEYSKRLHE